jgi:uncharacterized protein with PIN domain
MKRTREEMKAQLLAEAEMVIDELLDWNEGTLAPSLNQLEETILALRKHLSRRMAEIVLGDQEAVRPVPGPLCSTCGREMHYKGMKEVTLESQVGMLKLERAYYYCSPCRQGVFPPRSAASVTGEALERRSDQASGVAEWDCGL